MTFRTRFECMYQFTESLGKINTGSWNTMLIINDREFSMCIRESHYGVDKVLVNSWFLEIYRIISFSTIQPTRSYDDRIRVFFNCKFFSEILRHTVDIFWITKICRDISLLFLSIKDIISRECDESDSEYRGCLCKIFYSERIHMKTRFHANILRIIDCRICREIQKHIRFIKSKTLYDRLERTNITCMPICSDNIKYLRLRTNKIICKHPISSRNKYFLFPHNTKIRLLTIHQIHPPLTRKYALVKVGTTQEKSKRIFYISSSRQCAEVIQIVVIFQGYMHHSGYLPEPHEYEPRDYESHQRAHWHIPSHP